MELMHQLTPHLKQLRLSGILETLEAQAGVPVVLNTSFNGPGEPIVDTASDAMRFFRDSELDVLYIGNRRVSRVG